MNPTDTTGQEFAEVWAECQRLRQENHDLRQKLGLPIVEPTRSPPDSDRPAINSANVHSKSRPDEKVRLFRNLFRGREDVYAVRWEGRNGKVGYPPSRRCQSPGAC